MKAPSKKDLLALAKSEKKYCVKQAKNLAATRGFHWQDEGPEWHRWMGRSDAWLVLQKYLEGK